MNEYIQLCKYIKLCKKRREEKIELKFNSKLSTIIVISCVFL